MDFCGYLGGFWMPCTCASQSGGSSTHLQGCGCAGNFIINDFLLMAFLALLEAKLDFNGAKTLFYIGALK